LNREDLKLYLITDNNALKGRNFFEVIEEALKGGVTMVQLREKNLSPIDFTKRATKLKQLTKKYNVPLIINDNINIAFDCGADGLHIGQTDIAIRDARRIMRKDSGKILGVTASSVALANNAEKNGADYIGSGAVFATGTKNDAKFLSFDGLKNITQSLSIPVVAIGGITVENAHLLKNLGLAGLAVSSGIMGAENVYETAKYLRNLEL